MLTPDEADAIDNYRFDNRINTRSEAVRRMIKFGPDGERQKLFEQDLRAELWEQAKEEMALQLKNEFQDELKDARQEAYDEGYEEAKAVLKAELAGEWKKREKELREEWEQEGR